MQHYFKNMLKMHNLLLSFTAECVNKLSEAFLEVCPHALMPAGVHTLTHEQYFLCRSMIT